MSSVQIHLETQVLQSRCWGLQCLWQRHHRWRFPLSVHLTARSLPGCQGIPSSALLILQGRRESALLCHHRLESDPPASAGVHHQWGLLQAGVGRMETGWGCESHTSWRWPLCGSLSRKPLKMRRIRRKKTIHSTIHNIGAFGQIG